jgi:hypothetical protein
VRKRPPIGENSRKDQGESLSSAFATFLESYQKISNTGFPSQVTFNVDKGP